MTSILTNMAAMAALQTLRTIGANMADTQRQVSSGLRVQAAADNAAYWSISTTMRSDNMALSAVSDALGLGAAKVDVAYAGMESTADVLSEFRAKLVAAKEDGLDKGKIQTELDQLKDQLLSIATSASFNGVNWLNTNAPENLWNCRHCRRASHRPSSAPLTVPCGSVLRISMLPMSACSTWAAEVPCRRIFVRSEISAGFGKANSQE